MSETITAGKSSSFYLNAGNALTIVAASGGTATALRLDESTASGLPALESFSIADAETQILGPYVSPTKWRIAGLTGSVSWSQDVSARLANVDFLQFGSTEIAALRAGCGTSSAPDSTAVANKNALGFWFESTATSGDSRGLYLRQYFAGAGVSGEAARLFGTVDGVAAATGGTVNGAHISLSVQGAAGAVSGAGNALRATLGLGDGTTAGGTLAAIQVDSDFHSGATVPATCAGLRFTTSGSKAFNYVFAFDSVNAGVWDDDYTTEVTTISGALKVLVNGAVRYIPLYSGAPS